MFWKRWLLALAAVSAVVFALSCGDDDAVSPAASGGDEEAAAVDPTLIPAEWHGVWDVTATAEFLGSAAKRADDPPPMNYTIDLCEGKQFFIDLKINGSDYGMLAQFDGSYMAGGTEGLLFPDEDNPCNSLFDADVSGIVVGPTIAYTMTLSARSPGVPSCGIPGELPADRDQRIAPIPLGAVITATHSALDWPGVQLPDGSPPDVFGGEHSRTRPLWIIRHTGILRPGELTICGEGGGDDQGSGGIDGGDDQGGAGNDDGQSGSNGDDHDGSGDNHDDSGNGHDGSGDIPHR